MSRVSIAEPEEATLPASAREAIAAKIRALHAESGGLSRVHHTHAALYAQARRAFGSWRAAVQASGIDYRQEVDRSLAHGLERRDERRALARPLARFLADHPGAAEEALLAERPDLAQRVRACFGDLACAIAWLERRP